MLYFAHTPLCLAPSIIISYFCYGYAHDWQFTGFGRSFNSLLRNSTCAFFSRALYYYYDVSPTITEWQTIEDHIETFENSSAYEGFMETLKGFMSGVRSLVHYPLEPPPSKLLSSSAPVLELFQVTVKEAATFEEVQTAFKPVTEAWKKEGRKYAVSPNMDEGAKDQMVFVVAWQSKGEHFNAKKQDYFAKALHEAKTMYRIETYSHLNPIL